MLITVILIKLHILKDYSFQGCPCSSDVEWVLVPTEITIIVNPELNVPVAISFYSRKN